jgi:hypothetical protein
MLLFNSIINKRKACNFQSTRLHIWGKDSSSQKPNHLLTAQYKPFVASIFF